MLIFGKIQQSRTAESKDFPDSPCIFSGYQAYLVPDWNQPLTRKILRNALREIESLIEGREYQEAINRCQVILRSFSKNLSAYRLLGQAYLENSQYDEAADIFLRLLSSLPDDFEAHLGLSLIRESQNQLDAAIWHSERALEAKPGSQVLQAETTRLAMKQPPAAARPVELSRVALARLYMQGKLFPQALAELSAAWQENPARYDILVLIAQAYEQAGQTEEAIEASRKALEKLPYSLEANRIAFRGAMNGPEPANALPYRQRLQELDPYWSYVTPASLDASQVPDHAVSFE